MTTNLFWHWPDHNIGKRESRRLREEHNALANSHAELLAILRKFSALMPSDEGLGGRAPMAAFYMVAQEARDAMDKQPGAQRIIDRLLRDIRDPS